MNVSRPTVMHELFLQLCTCPGSFFLPISKLFNTPPRNKKFSVLGSSWYMYEGGQGESRKGFHEQLFCVSQVTKQNNSVIIDLDLGHLFAAINSLGKPAVGGSECTEVWSYIKRLRNEVKTNHQVLVTVVWRK